MVIASAMFVAEDEGEYPGGDPRIAAWGTLWARYGVERLWVG